MADFFNVSNSPNPLSIDSLDKRADSEGNVPDIAHDAVLRRVPTETLSHIFALALSPHQLGAEPAPWTISAVCSRWRETVIYQPLFWVFIDLRYFNRQKFTSRFRLETQLSRSGGLPLNVEFSAGERPITSEDSSLLRLIAEHAGRWETFSMSGPTSMYTELHACIREPFALLRVLTIEMQYDPLDSEDDGLEVDDDNVPILFTFKDAPRLQQVSANKTNFAPLSLELSWSQLLQFHGSSTWDGHLHALLSAANLVSCSLEIQIQGTPAIPEAPILLPHLLRLSLSQPAFIEYLDTPVLQELHCMYGPPLLSFLPRQRKLQKLVIHAPPSAPWPNTPDLARVVEAATTITDLALAFPPPAAFVRDFSRLSMVPALERLATYQIDNFQLQNDFMHAVESRWKHGLRSVTLPGDPGPWAPGILERIEALRSEGMDWIESVLKIHEAVHPKF